MDHFAYKNGILHAEEISIPALAKEIGTPFYCYSSATLLRHYTVFHEALASLKPLICFAVKSCSNPAVLATLAKAGAGADVVSEGEIRLALAAGVPASRIVFSGVGKTRAEMDFALQKNVFQFNAESRNELLTLNDAALVEEKVAQVALRVNPDVDAATHAKISTGHKASKFGISLDEARQLFTEAKNWPGLNLRGVSVHIGSQLTSLEPFREAFLRVKDFVAELRQSGFIIETIDLGGGLGVPYQKSQEPPLPAKYGALVQELFSDEKAQLMFEPGRLISGNAGILVTEVISIKETGEGTFVIVDAAMNDLLRPTLYEAYHEIVPVIENAGGETMTADIVGPVCESGDTFATGREISHVKAGDLLVFRTAGAYGAVMSSTYNSRLLTPEVMVNGNEFAIIRPRPSYEDMLRQHRMPEWL